MTLKVNGISIDRDDEGYLLNPDEWNQEIAIQLANEENLNLNDEYWKIVTFMRDFYEDNQISPGTRLVTKFVDTELGYGKDARNYLFRLFPYGYAKQACKIAGMKKPRAWSTG